VSGDAAGPSWLRPAVHAGAFGFAFLAPVIGRWGMAGAAAAALAGTLLVLPRTALGRALARPGEPRWNGVHSYPLAVALLFALLPLEAAVAGWAMLAFGDPAASLAGGGGRGGRALPWNPRKTVGGTITFLTAALAARMFLTAAVLPEVRGIPADRLFQETETLGIYAAWMAAGALAGAFAETLDLGIDDNLPVALAAGGTLALVSP
jgi:dolichol kinase